MLRTVYFIFAVFFLFGCRSQKAVLQHEDIVSIYQSRIDSLTRELDLLKEHCVFDSRKAEPGKAYVAAMSEPVFEHKDTTVIIYTGNDIERDDIQVYQLRVQDAYSSWKKLDASNICGIKSYDNIESYALSYVENPAIYQTLYIVQDTSENKDWELQTFTIKRLVRQSELSAMRAMSCPSVCGFDIYKKVKEALLLRGYKMDMSKPNSFSLADKELLLEFQKKNNLSVGQLDYETLKALDVNQ